MNEHEPPADPAFDRLMAADPARRAPDPAQGVLRAKVDALIAEPAGAPAEPAGAPAERERADELAVRRHRRRTPWLVAAAVAGIVAAGGGGYLAGESGLGIGPVSDTVAGGSEEAPSVMSAPEDDGAEKAGTGEGRADRGEAESGTAPESGPDGVAPLGAGDDLPAATGLVFHAGAGLSDAPATAEVRVAGQHGESLGTYPVVSEVEAVERLGDPRFTDAVLGRDGQDRSGEEAGPRAAPPAPGGPIVWPVEDVTIVSAALTEVRYAPAGGTPLLVPAYELTADDGERWTVLAVDDEVLDFAP